MSAGSLMSNHSSISRSSGGSSPPTFHVPANTLITRITKDAGISCKITNLFLIIVKIQYFLQFVSFVGYKQGYLISFAVIYCALNVSEFRLLDLGSDCLSLREK